MHFSSSPTKLLLLLFVDYCTLHKTCDSRHAWLKGQRLNGATRPGITYNCPLSPAPCDNIINYMLIWLVVVSTVTSVHIHPSFKRWVCHVPKELWRILPHTLMGVRPQSPRRLQSGLLAYPHIYIPLSLKHTCTAVGLSVFCASTHSTETTGRPGIKIGVYQAAEVWRKSLKMMILRDLIYVSF